MKKILNLVLFSLILTSLLFIVGCSDKVLKSTYTYNEVATLDNYDLTLTNVLEDDKNLYLTFQISNNEDKTSELDADFNFRYFENNKQINNIYNSNLSNKVLYNKSINYTVEYPITDNNKDDYEIYFYSGVVENNIKITFNKNDIKKDR